MYSINSRFQIFFKNVAGFFKLKFSLCFVKSSLKQGHITSSDINATTAMTALLINSAAKKNDLKNKDRQT